jgi:hypothetical protein
MTEATTMAVPRSRNIGRSPTCVKANNEDYKEHRMRTIYMRSLMGDGRARNSRSMIPIGYYCFQCEMFWSNEDEWNSYCQRLGLIEEADIQQ